MSEWRKILELWRQAQAAGDEACLATVVRTEGSSYRKPGARMLLTRRGRRVGTLSGGCLEAEIQKKAWWLTRNGAAVECYGSTYEGDSDIPYGLACGGKIWVLLERGEDAARVLRAISDCVEHRMDVAFVASIEDRNSSRLGTRLIVGAGGSVLAQKEPGDAEWMEPAQRTLTEEASQWIETAEGVLFLEFMAPPQRLFVLGAGDDAQAVVQFAHALGWQTIVAEGRSHLATSGRFPLAESVHVLPAEETSLASLEFGGRDAVVIMTHSYEQDREFLRHMLAISPAYLGVLGPRHRTDWLLRDIAARSGAPDVSHLIHAPAGLDIGGEGPAAIALSILAEIQSVLAANCESRAQSTVAFRATMATPAP